MIHVLATIQAVSGRRAELLTEFSQIIEPVRAEEGCLEYGPAIDVQSGIDAQTTNPDAFTVIERWESLEALKAHLNAPHMQVYRKKTANLVDSLELKILESC